ncbi:MAG: hypothetical protein LBG30_04425 [Odoribacteraceae bacterium]|jgi:hypothetical protein|nr:hypothetical protein [Odoribacteraceae bacterium]
MPRKTQPTKDSEWIAWAQKFNTDCTTNATALKLTTAQLQAMGILVYDAKTAYDANSVRGSRTHATVAAKNAAFKALRAHISALILTLVGNEAIPNELLDSLGLPTRIHTSHEPKPAPSHTPDLKVESGQHHVVDAYVSNPQHGQATTYARAPEEHSIAIRLKFEGEEGWREQHSSRLHTRLIFTDAEVGKRLSIQAAWTNARFEHGPWSDVVTVIIN